MPNENEVINNENPNKLSVIEEVMNDGDENIYANEDLRKEVALALAEQMNNTAAEQKIPDYDPITEEDIDKLIADEEKLSLHLECKKLQERSVKQHEILHQYTSANAKLPKDQQFKIQNTNTFLYAFIDPADTKEAKAKNDALFEKIRKQGDFFIADQAMEIARNFETKNYFPKDNRDAMKIYAEHSDELNILFALNRNISNNITPGMSEEWKKVYSDNIKLYEATANAKLIVEAIGSTTYLLLPEEKCNTLVSLMAARDVQKNVIDVYSKKGVDFGPDPTNKISNLNDLKRVRTECEKANKVMDQLPEKMSFVTAEVLDEKTNEYKHIKNSDAITALSEGKQVKFTELDKNVVDMYKGAEAKTINDKITAKNKLIEVDKYKEYLQRLQDTHTIFHNTFLSTDSDAFKNMENALTDYIEAAESAIDKAKKISKNNPANNISAEDFKLLADKMEKIERTSEAYYQKNKSVSRNPRKEERFQIAKEIFENTDGQQLKLDIMGETQSKIIHRRHMSIMEAADIKPINGQVSKAVVAPSKDIGKNGPSMGPEKK
ncbi:MAG: hypothetical protein MJ068_01115 [Clostridia bacterium]|nr:hypothetical protein [Clostridia bacterium]